MVVCVNKILVMEVTDVIFEFQVSSLWKLHAHQNTVLKYILPVTEPLCLLVDSVTCFNGLFLIENGNLSLITCIEKQLFEITYFEAQRNAEVIGAKFLRIEPIGPG